MSELRGIIGAPTYDHEPFHSWHPKRPYIECRCGKDFRSSIEWTLHLADMLIDALGFTQETRQLDDGYGGISINREGTVTTHNKPSTTVTRYATKWEPQ